MNEVTQLLNAASHGDGQAANQLLPLVYDELRRLAAQKLAHEKAGQTLEATALVHEAFVRLVDVEHEPNWGGRGHFFAAAAEAMRRILVDQARRKKSQKHGGDRKRVELIDAQAPADDERMLALDDALTKLGCRRRVGYYGLSSAPALGVRAGLAFRNARRRLRFFIFFRQPRGRNTHCG
jgi:RNA polymerase sigma factor (TIGR02999 family)